MASERPSCPGSSKCHGTCTARAPSKLFYIWRKSRGRYPWVPHWHLCNFAWDKIGQSTLVPVEVWKPNKWHYLNFDLIVIWFKVTSCKIRQAAWIFVPFSQEYHFTNEDKSYVNMFNMKIFFDGAYWLQGTLCKKLSTKFFIFIHL